MITAKFAFVGIIFIAPLIAAPYAATDDLTLAKIWNDTAARYMDRGAYEEARQLYLRSLPVFERALGAEHSATITTIGNLCGASVHLTAYVDAKPLCTRALALREKAFGPDDLTVAESLSDLALVYVGEGDLRRAESLFQRALRIESARPDSTDMPRLLNNLGFLYFHKKKYGRAETYFESAITSIERSRGSEDPDLIAMFGNAATVYLANHEYRAAEERYRRALALSERLYGSPQANNTQALIGLARAEAAQGRRSEAGVFLQRARALSGAGPNTYLQWRRALDAAESDILPR